MKRLHSFILIIFTMILAVSGRAAAQLRTALFSFQEPPAAKAEKSSPAVIRESEIVINTTNLNANISDSSVSNLANR